MWKRIAAGVVAVLVAAAIYLLWPESAAGEVRGLEHRGAGYDAVILRDTFGVPHLLGSE